jgi:hypothetical protein
MPVSGVDSPKRLTTELQLCEHAKDVEEGKSNVTPLLQIPGHAQLARD